MEGDVWDFPIDSPAQTSRRSTTMNERNTKSKKGRSKGMEEVSVTSKSARRNSTTSVNKRSATREAVRGSSVETDESPRIPRKRKLTRQIEDSDTERIESPGPEFQELDEDLFVFTKENYRVHLDEIVTIDSNPRKHMVTVEIPSKLKLPSRTKTALEEIMVDNILTPDKEEIPTPDTSPVKSIPSQNTPEPRRPSQTTATELENVVLENAPPTPPRCTEEKIAVPMSPARPMNIASILAKSPNRPMYRVGLSRRVNIEPLHGYLKKNV